MTFTISVFNNYLFAYDTVPDNTIWYTALTAPICAVPILEEYRITCLFVYMASLTFLI